MEKIIPGLEDFSDFEQRGRSYTWPTQVLSNPGSPATVNRATDPCLSPNVRTPTVRTTFCTTTAASTSSSASLAWALESNLSLASEKGPVQNVAQVVTPIATSQTPQVQVQSAAAATYPSLSHLLTQRHSSPNASDRPPPSPLPFSSASLSNLTGISQVTDSGSTTYSSVPNLVPVQQVASGLEVPVLQAASRLEVPALQAASDLEVPVQQATSSLEVPLQQATSSLEVPLQQATKPVLQAAPNLEIPVQQPLSNLEVPIQQATSGLEVPVATPSLEVPVATPSLEVPVQQAASGLEVPLQQASSLVEVPVQQAVSGVLIPLPQAAPKLGSVISSNRKPTESSCASSSSQVAAAVDDDSTQILSVVPVDPQTATNLSLPASKNVGNSAATVVTIQPLPSSSILLGSAISVPNISADDGSNPQSAVPLPRPPTSLPSIITEDLDATVPYFAAPAAEERPLGDDPEDPGEVKPVKKKRIRKRTNGLVSQKKPNPWGEESYSDLIAKALESSGDGRMRLNEIYSWFATNVPYFANRTSQEESAGWKNSIRHNLSLHSRFMRIQNEGAGKSSWWVINPDAKPGRNPRRQRSATLETSTKAAIDKKRRGARKKVMEMRAGGGSAGGTLHSASSSIVGSQAPMLSRELYGDNDDSLNFESFHPRTQSNISLSASSSRVSPSVMENYENFESFDFPPFVEAGVVPHDILDRTNEMNLNQSDSPAFHRPMANPMLNGTSAPATSNLIAHIKTESPSNRNENGVQPPPSYHELNVVRGVQNIQNPLLRTHLIQNRIPSQPEVSYNGTYSTSAGNIGISNWMQSGVGAQIGIHPAPVSCAAQQSFSGNTTALPMDLENLALPDQPLMEVENMEAVIRHELSQSTSSQLSFDNI